MIIRTRIGTRLRPLCLAFGITFGLTAPAQAGFLDWLSGGSAPDIMNAAEREQDLKSRLQIEDDLSKPKRITCGSTAPTPEQLARNPFLASLERLAASTSATDPNASGSSTASGATPGGATAASPAATPASSKPPAKEKPTGKAKSQVKPGPAAPTPPVFSYLGGRAPCYSANGNLVFTGGQVINELKRMRDGFAGLRVSQAMTLLNNQLNGGGGLTSDATGAAMGNLASVAADVAINYLTTELSYQAVDYVLAMITEDTTLLDKIDIEMPDASRLPLDMQMRIKTMGAYLTLIKAANIVLGTGQRSFYLAKESYREVISAREDYVKVLGRGRLARDGIFLSRADLEARGESLNSDDQEYLARFEGKKFEDLLADRTATEMVANYLQKRDPDGLKDIRLKQAEMRSHHDAYLRAAGGAASTLAFTAIFLRNTQKFVQAQKTEGAKIMLPLIEQGITEVITLAPRVVKVLAAGDGIYEGTFILEKDGQVVRRGLSGVGALDAMDADSREAFKKQMLTPETGKGMLARLYARSPDLALEFADLYASRDSRLNYARSTVNWDDVEFTFRNSLPLVDKARRKELTSVLQIRYGSDEPGMETASLLQQEMIDMAVKKMSNEQIRLLMYASTAAGASTTPLRVGNYTIRMETPGVSGIADYEKFGIGNIKATSLRIPDHADLWRWGNAGARPLEATAERSKRGAESDATGRSGRGQPGQQRGKGHRDGS